MWKKLVKVTLKTGKRIEVLPEEVEILKEKGLLKEADHPGKESDKLDTLKKEPEKKLSYKLPVLTTKEKRNRIKEAKKLRKQGYPLRYIAKKIGVSHVSILKWVRK